MGNAVFKTVDGSNNFNFTDKDFQFIAKRLGEHAGIVLSEIKKDLVYGRLVRRLRQLRLSSFSEYCALLEHDDGAEFEEFVNALTTNLTGFYRENHHFDYLAETVVPEFVKEKSSKTLRVWSAGCSTGVEAYSVAITLAETLPSGWDVKVLATDIDSKVIHEGRRAVYDADWVSKSMTPERLKKWFFRGAGSNSNYVKVKPEIADMVTFNKLNLMENWPMRQSFDIIFCRNTVIYFEKDTQKALFDRMANQMHQKSYLFIGHSESLSKICDRFSLVGKTVYKRIR